MPLLTLTIIVPTLNEAEHIIATLSPLQVMRSRGVEVLLIDGGSTDNTLALAVPLCDKTILSEPGRATQMNVGAAAANGEALLFLHADTILPDAADTAITAALSTADWGRFDVRLRGKHRLLGMVAWMMNQRSRLSSIATGDQGIFVKRDTFMSLGGYANIRLMEDIEICKRLKKISAPANLRRKIITSGRRWDTHGLWRTIWLMWQLRGQYFFGADAEQLHKKYYEK